MELKEKNYNFIDVILIVYKAYPFGCIIKLITTIVTGIQPALMVICTADFISNAISVSDGTKNMLDLFLPLFFLMLLIGNTWISSSVMKIVSCKIKMKLFEKFRLAITLRRAKLAYYQVENNDTYDLIKRVSSDPAIRMKDAFDTMMWLSEMTLNIFSIVFLLLFKMFGVAVVILAISIPTMYLAMKNGKINYDGFKKSGKFVRRYEYLGEVLSRRDAVQERAMFGFSNKVGDRYINLYEEARTILFDMFRKILLRTSVSDTLSICISIIISIIMINPVLTGKLSFPLFVSLVGSIFSLIQYSSRRIPHLVSRLSEFYEYLTDLTSFCKLETVEGADKLPKQAPEKFKQIIFHNVYFKYPGTDMEILKGLSFIIEANKHYAFVGANGAGKSTIIKLLTGLYPNYTGEIIIDGRELKTIPSDELKGYFSIVYQDFAKYSITIEENIAVGAGVDMTVNMPDITMAEDLLSIKEISDSLVNGKQAVIGKAVANGQDLSGGQWQRIAMARAISNPAPLLILDEPTAALDPISESEVYENFSEISKSRTTLFISHRLGSTKLADEIIVIDGGRVVAQGTHTQLMNDDGLYAEMYDSQRSWYQ